MSSSPIEALRDFLTRSNEKIRREQKTSEKFRQMLLHENRRGKRPVALVKRNKEVSFREIPFFDKDGERIAVVRERKNGRERIVVQRHGKRRKRRRQETDPLRVLETRLSEHTRIDRTVPGFRKAAARLLLSAALSLYAPPIMDSY